MRGGGRQRKRFDEVVRRQSKLKMNAINGVGRDEERRKTKRRLMRW